MDGSIFGRQDPPIKTNYAVAKEMFLQAEQNNRNIQERVREAYHRLPFMHLLHILVNI